MDTKRISAKIADTEWSFETGHVAGQANGAVVVRVGDVALDGLFEGTRAAVGATAQLPLGEQSKPALDEHWLEVNPSNRP